MTITWRKDPTVAERAVLGRHEAQLWGTGPGGDTTAWCVYDLGGVREPVAEGQATTFGEAKAQAETALRGAEAGAR